MINYLLQGMLFGLAYVAPIGTQNLYVINAATNRTKLKTYQVAFVTVFFDITLALSCFFGFGFVIEKFLLLKAITILLGSLIVTFIGIGLLRNTNTSSNIKDDMGEHSLLKTIAACFAVTWLNPQAIIDGSLLLGSFRALIPTNMACYFMIGVCIASFAWFNLLATLAFTYRNKFIKAIKVINMLCGLILIFYGIKLAYSFILLIK